MELAPSAEQTAFLDRVEAFASSEVRPLAASIDESDAFPRELLAKASAIGLSGVTIPQEWGGAGRDVVTYAMALEAIARASATLAVILSVSNSLVASVLHRDGTSAQKDLWLARLASGSLIGAFALSEEDAGSDAANQQTVATMDDRGYVLNGRKVWVANAEAAGLFIVFAATQPDASGRGISAFIVPSDAAGLSLEKVGESLGVRGLGCRDVILKDVRVESGALIGEPGRGFHLAMKALEGGRVAIAAQALGIGQAALDESLAYARRREAFGQPIANYQAIQFMLADMATELDAARMLTLKAADACDRQSSAAVEAAMAKLSASQAAHRAADSAMQIFASAGYRRGTIVERLSRDVRATEIYQGTSEVQRMIIAEDVLR
ncbi:MAG: acyl-CoA dehydrogenase family protein [Acidobacteriota bacterium]|nr:acyl-CoA dehydrogenase family protein [Acidobacteriota bacterium]